MRRRPRSLHRLLAAAFAIIVAGPVAAAGQSTPTVDIHELDRGDRGYGLSVFAGTEPERFDVEVIGVLERSQADLDFLLVRLSGRDLEQSGVAAGMSGSPVYFDDRLAGAVAYSWQFAEEPIALVTPIDAMRALDGPGLGGSAAAGSGVELLEAQGCRRIEADELLDWEPGTSCLGLSSTSAAAESLVRDGLRRLTGAVAGEGSTAVAWGLEGFTAEAGLFLASELGSIPPMGRSDEADESSSTLAPGSSVAAVLVDGDLRMAATGTVTDRDGDEVIAFGHPFLGRGEVAIPMAESEVLTVLSSQVNSFKISNAGAVVGAFDRDRLAGIRGRIGAVAPTIPMELVVATRDGEERYELELARIEGLTPTLMAVATLGGLSSAWGNDGPMSLDVDVVFELAEWGEVRMEQSFDGSRAPIQAASYVLAYARFLTENSYASVDLERVTVRVEQSATPRAAIVVGGYADHSRVRPGDQVRLFVDLATFRGPVERREVVLSVPTDVPAGRYWLIVGDGLTLDSIRLAVEPRAPIHFRQALDLVRGFRSRRDLVVLSLIPSSGLAVAGEVMPRLPGSVQQLWTTAPSQSATPLRFASDVELAERLDVPLAGAVRIDLEVVRREPTGYGELTGGGSAVSESGPGDSASGSEAGGDGE